MDGSRGAAVLFRVPRLVLLRVGTVRLSGEYLTGKGTTGTENV